MRLMESRPHPTAILERDASGEIFIKWANAAAARAWALPRAPCARIDAEYPRWASVCDAALASGRPVEIDAEGRLFTVTPLDENTVAMESRPRDERFDMLFSQHVDGVFFMTLDEPIDWRTRRPRSPPRLRVHHLRITEINEAMCEQLGAPRNELLGSVPRDRWTATSAAQWRERHALALRPGPGPSHATRVAGRRSLHWVEGAYVCTYDAQGRITGHYGTQRDVTEDAAPPPSSPRASSASSSRSPAATSASGTTIRSTAPSTTTGLVRALRLRHPDASPWTETSLVGGDDAPGRLRRVRRSFRAHAQRRGAVPSHRAPHPRRQRRLDLAPHERPLIVARSQTATAALHRARASTSPSASCSRTGSPRPSAWPRSARSPRASVTRSTTRSPTSCSTSSSSIASSTPLSPRLERMRTMVDADALRHRARAHRRARSPGAHARTRGPRHPPRADRDPRALPRDRPPPDQAPRHVVRELARDPRASSATRAAWSSSFLNLIVNAAQAIPEGYADHNQIRVATSTDARRPRPHRDHATPAPASRPSTSRASSIRSSRRRPSAKAPGSASRSAARSPSPMGGDIEVDTRAQHDVPRPAPRRPRARRHAGPAARARARPQPPRPRHRRRAATSARCSGACCPSTRSPPRPPPARLSSACTSGERFDHILCDLMMPDLTGMDFYDALAAIEPALQRRVIFIIAAPSPIARGLPREVTNPRLDKPFDIAELAAILRPEATLSSWRSSAT